MKYYDYAFFSAYTTIQSFEEPVAFYERDILKIFNDYVTGLKAIGNLANKTSNFGNSDKKSIVYKPVPYCLFGEFDLAVFSLIDDFSFASKKFKPSPVSENFKYQVNTGVIPVIDVYKPKLSLTDKFQKKMLNNFFSGRKVYPFTGITSVKLNNAMLIGVGQQFVEVINFYLVAFIDNYIKKQENADKDFSMFYIISENLGWNELTINFFGNSLRNICEIANLIKENRLRDILGDLIKLDEKVYNKLEVSRIIAIIKRVIGQKSFLADLIKNEKIQNPKTTSDYLESHPIVASTTVYGYHIDNLKFYSETAVGSKNNLPLFFKNKTYQKYLNENVISIAWSLKPGHEANANKAIFSALPQSVKKRLPDNSKVYQYCQVGKFPYVFPSVKISLREYYGFINSANSICKRDFTRNIIRMKSEFTYDLKIDYKQYDEKRHFEYKLKNYVIDTQDFKMIRERLRTIPIPHTIKSQLENLILNFNDAITDPLMYNYFIGLRSPLLKFLEEKVFINQKVFRRNENQVALAGAMTLKLKLYNDFSQKFGSVAVTQKRNEPSPYIFFMDVEMFTNFIDPWNKAFWNRYFHGYYFTEINDFNIEHHGGIQQILFSYDIIYKIISKRVYGSFSKDPFVNVRTYPIIKSTKYDNSINFTHLFKPAIYACECVHEVANHVIPFIVLDCQNPNYSFLINARSKPDEITKNKSQKFETGLKQNAGTKDAYEVKFIEDYFGFNSIRYLFTDYISFMVGYNFSCSKKNGRVKILKEPDHNKLIMYYHTHWYLFLTRADLYRKNLKDDDSSWYFSEEDFRFLFIRSNLMFYIMCGYDDIKKLKKINAKCPSVELNVLWSTLMDSLLNFVVRLGDAIKLEFAKMGTGNDAVSIEEFKSLIDVKVLYKNNFADKQEENQFSSVISYNYRLIESLHNFFKYEGGDFFNITKRNSNNNEINENVKINVDFYKEHSGRELFLDPKGNIFSTTESKRKEVLKNNITYLKKIWHVAMLNVKNYYFKMLN